MLAPHRTSIGHMLRALRFAASVSVILLTRGAQAQTPEEHASHHPGAAPAAGAMPATPGAPGMAGMGPLAGAGPPAAAGGMMAGMGDMMKSMMGQTPPKELYPALMALPDMTPEKRQEIEQQAAGRMHTGTALMGQALDALNAGAQSDNYAAMHEATTRLREGIAQLESGIAARRSLAEGRAPREVALGWFKQEMRLTSPVADEDPHGARGLSVLHLFTMALLIVFAFAMLAMYYFKMRRAASLFGRIDPDNGSPPPGSAPPLVGGPGPSTPPAAKVEADSPAPPATDKTPAHAPGDKPRRPASTDKKAKISA